MQRGNGRVRAEAIERLRVGHEAIGATPTQRVGPVEYHDANPSLGGGLHDEPEDVDMLIEAGPDVLNVVEQHVHAVQHLR